MFVLRLDVKVGAFAEVLMHSDWGGCADYILSNFGGSIAGEAQRFIDRFNEEVSDICEGEKCIEGKEDEFDEILNQWNIEFNQFLNETILESLMSEYDYRTSREAIEETILCNNYEFTEDGKLY